MSEQPMDETRLEEFLDRKKIDRRRFLQQFARGSISAAAVAAAHGLIPRLFKPAYATLYPNRVTRVYSENATSWDFSSGYYFDAIAGDVARQMVNQAVQDLTDATSAAAAWNEIMASYVPGDKVAIKINLNNIYNTSDIDNNMDAVAPVIDAVVAALNQNVDVPLSDILVYDSQRALPIDRLVNSSAYPSVFSDDNGSWRDGDPSVWNDSVIVTIRDPVGNPAYVCNVSDLLTQCEHLINIPLLKRHPEAAVTGAMKNHYGSVSNCFELHTQPYRRNGSYIGDINNHPEIRGKTRLIVADALFGSWAHNQGPPRQWQIFNNGSPNSVLASLDPVAIDSVMFDIINDERNARGYPEEEHGHLEVAMNYHGLGVHEHKPYSEISYRESELGQTTTTRADIDRIIKEHKEGQATDSQVISVIDSYMSGE